MKTIMLIVALISFTAMGSYAQNKNCCCKKKVTHHKAVVQKPATTQTETEAATLYIPVKEVSVCYRYRQHNIVVTECPDAFYDNSGNIEFNADNAYLGYYPKVSKPDAADKPSTTCKDNRVAPGSMTQQHTKVIEQCDAAPVSEPYFCLWNCPKR